MSWRRQARTAQASNRIEMAMDEDFYDAIQYDETDLKILNDRDQAPLVFNVIKNTVNWILGTERKSRLDYRVLPRTKRFDGANTAKTKTKLIKYVQDVNMGEFVRSAAFAECIKAGVGWIETGARRTGDEPLFMNQERWRNMWFDHLGTRIDCLDWRYVIREKWADLDVAQGLFPERAEALRVLSEAVNSLYPYHPDDIAITDEASEFDLEQDLDAMFGGPFEGSRPRVKFIEMEYRMPANVKIMRMRDNDTPFGVLDGKIFRPNNEDHRYLVHGGYFTLDDAFMMTVRRAMWAGALYLQDVLSPYDYNRFSFIPLFCYRRARDNMPYGVIRDLRDPQSDLNKRRARSLFLLSAKQLLYERSAVSDPKKVHEELQRPDALIEFEDGALSSGKVKVEGSTDLAMGHVELARDDERFINSISGVTDPNLGQAKKDLSGKAIINLQNQGLTSSGVFFDNYYLGFQMIGENILCLIEQFYDTEKEVLITGDQVKDEFIDINQWDEEKRTIRNSIIATKARFIVGKQDFRESIRMAMFEMLSELVQNLSQTMPEVALSLLDLVVEYMDDLPNKDEMVARIRKINKQSAPEDELTPEQREEQKVAKEQDAQQQAQAAAMQQALAQLEMAIKQAEAENKVSQALKNRVDAQMKKLEGFLKALEVAGALSGTPALAEAADQLMAEAQTAGDSGQQQITDGGM